MFSIVISLLVLVHLTPNPLDAAGIETIKHCCNLGTNHSIEGNVCGRFKTPIDGVSEGDTVSCLHSIEICCKRKERDKQCDEGESMVLSGQGCDTADGLKKACCEACVLGKESFSANPTCDDYLNLGLSFTKCCQASRTTTTSSTPTSTTASSSFTTGTTSKSSVASTTTTRMTRDYFPGAVNLCEVEGVCAQICIPMGDSYKCDCNKGYTLMGDKISCKLDKNNKKGRCDLNNPCEQECVDTGVAIKCSCREGFELDIDNTSCKDIDECTLGIHDCTDGEVCLNEYGTYYCEDVNFTDPPSDYDKKCPVGYKFDGEKSTCDDINECEISLLCPSPKVCKNTIGSYICEGNAVVCPPGYYYKSATESCMDVDECITGENSCNKESQICVNTKGNYSCVEKVSKKTCPAGFKKNSVTQLCDDVNECDSDIPVCGTTEDCLNEEGSYTCVPKKNVAPPTPIPAPTTPKQKLPAPKTTKRRPYYPPTTPRPITCKTGFTLAPDRKTCLDINECQVGLHNCAETQRCDNTVGSFHCVRMAGCGTGYTYNYASEICEDDDECELGTHNCGGLGSGFKCRNTFGSYRCDPIRRAKPTTTTTTTTPTRSRPTARVVTEPPIISGQRKKCLPGYIKNQRGDCEDVDECLSNPCGRGEACLNLQGRFQCITKVSCKKGYELNDAGDGCKDVNECVRGTHKCSPTQICRNGDGYYTCECPPGHQWNPGNKQCEDINECKYERVCFNNEYCVNTVGSYRCDCREGFRNNGSHCEDIDECGDDTNLCEHKCVNLWGSYRCVCNAGFILNGDNRTCTDIDECEKFRDKKLCVGTCENTPGSYKCTCPSGYRLGDRDRRTCQDIDECLKNPCPNRKDICVNTRGSYKCYDIRCPRNYIRDSVHKSRCKRPPTLCDPRDMECLLSPEQYTYHFIAMVSDIPILNRPINLFSIRGPRFARARTDFGFKIINSNCPLGIPRINSNYFMMDTRNQNEMSLNLTRSIKGPQEAQIEVEMKLFDHNALTMTTISRIFIIVTEWPF